MLHRVLCRIRTHLSAASAGLPAILVLAVNLMVMPARVSAAEPILMEVGQTHVLPAPGLTRIAVGSGQVIQAQAVDAREVILFARKEGVSSVHVWTDKQNVRAYDVRVMPAGFGQMRAEVESLLASMPQLRFSVVGHQIVIEGAGLSDEHKQRLTALAARYPEVLDLTGDVGWEQMVLLDVQVVELPRTRLSELGLVWESTSPQSAGSAANGPWGSLQWTGLHASLGARLQALAQRGEAVFLARPRLLARSGSAASFLAGGEIPYPSADGEGKGATVFKPYGVALTITPRIDPRGTIRSRIEVEASSIDPTITVPAGPAMRTRRATTEFNLPSGQTLVLGGFLSRERTQQTGGLPWLSELPIVGALFGTRREQARDTELAIFVTPTIVKPDDPALAQEAARGNQLLRRVFTEPAEILSDSPAPSPDGPRPAWANSQWSDPNARSRAGSREGVSP
ncbi:type II and III secretion system protein family protein [Bordetella holmesii]|uniref:Type IV pilus biogenesis and competence protein PilQ n=3 Tax=Bordetella holmesii TaxID=35814 RepID=A0A158M3Z5_9BORD|nr:pilus assembly protein N-terminal domain-containing protein [Bordetella holmesii]AIT27814.1 bacterial type II and III secretion system family protein [Bordetella holmesii 44057]EWM40589.1 bacterial type II and III secretion system family protein [Bordetella holmesii 35009]EWM42011.1 bacterial type II and III secretion system family protein [Bordetella holmesii 41130]KCV13015.1 type II and III secretion system protein [Bordetella holmesii 04P3421]AMD46580.1 secretion protein [Bordetella holm